MGHFLGCRHDNVIIKRAQKSAEFSHVLADLPLGAIALDRAAFGLQRDPEPEVPQVVRDPEDNALGKPEHLGLAEELQELPTRVQAPLITEVLSG